MLTQYEFVERLKNVLNYKTLFVRFAYGAPLTEENKQRFIDISSLNRKTHRLEVLRKVDNSFFAFDCNGLIMATLWDWKGDKTHFDGGAVYGAHGIPYLSPEDVIANLENKSNDFFRIQVGEIVWMGTHHVGVYIGNGFTIECNNWEPEDIIPRDRVFLAGCKQDKVGYNRTDWDGHGKLPYVSYDGSYESAFAN